MSTLIVPEPLTKGIMIARDMLIVRYQPIGRHSTAKRPDGCRPAAITSNPDTRANSRNSARFRSFPPTNTSISNSGDGPWPSSGDTPPRMTIRPVGRAASEQRRRRAIASRSGQSASTFFSR